MEHEQVTIARGDKTYDAREVLKQSGFKWNPDHKWWQRSPALDESDRFTLVKQLRRMDLADGVEVKNVRKSFVEASP